MALKNPVTGGTWNTAMLNAVFTATGSPFLAPAYRKDAFGVVYLRGRASYVSGDVATVFTLPSGFRPTGTVRVLAPSTDFNGLPTTVWLDLKTNGNVDYVSGTVYTISFDQISFATY